METPGLPVKTKLTYILQYFSGNNPKQCMKFFIHEGDLKSAIQRGRDHCSLLNLKFVHVRPMIDDLEVQEKEAKL